MEVDFGNNVGGRYTEKWFSVFLPTIQRNGSGVFLPTNVSDEVIPANYSGSKYAKDFIIDLMNHLDTIKPSWVIDVYTLPGQIF